MATGTMWRSAALLGPLGADGAVILFGAAMADGPDGVRARADQICGTADAEGLRDVLTRS